MNFVLLDTKYLRPVFLVFSPDFIITFLNSQYLIACDHIIASIYLNNRSVTFDKHFQNCISNKSSYIDDRLLIPLQLTLANSGQLFPQSIYGFSYFVAHTTYELYYIRFSIFICISFGNNFCN